MEIKIAVATDDGVNLISRHFGDADKYLLYLWNTDSGKIDFQEERQGKLPEEKQHADPRKAQAVGQLLKDAQVLINMAFGPNIVRIRKKFIPVVSRITDIKSSLELLKSHQEKILSNLTAPEKEIIYLGK